MKRQKPDKLDDLVLQAKLYSDRIAFKKIYSHMRFMLDDIYRAFSIVYDFVKNNKIEFYHYYYIVVWESINNYDFLQEEEFPYFFKKFVISKIKKYIIREYRVRPKNIVSDETLDKLMSNISGYYDRWMEKEHYLNSLSDLTPKQLQAVYLDCYKEMTRPEAADFLGISENTFNDRLRYSYERVRNYVYGLRSKYKRERVYETVVVSDSD